MNKEELQRLTADEISVYELQAIATKYARQQMSERNVSARDIALYLDISERTIQRRIENAEVTSIILDVVRQVEYIKLHANDPETLRAYARRLTEAADRAESVAAAFKAKPVDRPKTRRKKRTKKEED